MKKQAEGQKRLSASEVRLIKQLRKHPEMLERIQSILDITGNTDGSNKKADEVEDLLVREMRLLGLCSLREWAVQTEEQTSQEAKEQDPTVRSRKKKR